MNLKSLMMPRHGQGPDDARQSYDYIEKLRIGIHEALLNEAVRSALGGVRFPASALSVQVQRVKDTTAYSHLEPGKTSLTGPLTRRVMLKQLCDNCQPVQRHALSAGKRVQSRLRNGFPK